MNNEIIIAKLNNISADSSWDKVTDDYIVLTIYNFDWLDNEKAVEEVLEWLEENADFVENDFYDYYHFGDIVVEVGYTAFDI